MEISSRAKRVFESRGLNEKENLVEEIKTNAAALYDSLEKIGVPPGNSEGGRLVSLAKTELETTVMWATKAVSRSHDV